MNAAVADYTPRTASQFKLKKSTRGLVLRLAAEKMTVADRARLLGLPHSGAAGLKSRAG